jgi:hypothetical protein
MTIGDFDEASPEVKEQIQGLRDMAVKVVPIGLGRPSVNKIKSIASGDDIAVIPTPGEEVKETKRVPLLIAQGMFHYNNIDDYCCWYFDHNPLRTYQDTVGFVLCSS